MSDGIKKGKSFLACVHECVSQTESKAFEGIRSENKVTYVQEVC